MTAYTATFRGARARGPQVAAAGALLVGCLIPVGLAFSTVDRFTESILALAAIQGLYAASWDLLGGVAGRVSLGHALPFGGGAYLAAVLGGLLLLPPPAAIACAAAGGALLAGLQGLLTGRLRPAFLALVTLAIAECGHELSGMLRVYGPAGFAFGGEGGIPAPLFPPDEFGAARLAAVVFAAAVVGLVGIARSNTGLAMRTARADPRAASVSGIDVGRVRLLAFAVSGGTAGVAGALTAGLAARASPSMLALETSLFAVAAASFGGSGTILGPAAAAYLLTAALQWAEVPGPARLTLYGAVLIVATLAGPGSAVWIRTSLQRLWGRPGRG